MRVGCHFLQSLSSWGVFPSESCLTPLLTHHKPFCGTINRLDTHLPAILATQPEAGA
jgi:hypothetical protein